MKKQQKLDLWLNLTSKGPPSELKFFDLPYNIRRQIYLLVDLVRDCPIDLNSLKTNNEEAEDALDPKPENSPHEPINYCFDRKYFCYQRHSDHYRSDCDECEPLSLHLLYVSRAFNAEASHIMYSQNSFKVLHGKPGGFSRLLRLGPQSLAALTSLSVRLNICWSCSGRKAPDCSCSKCNPLCNCLTGDKPLGQVSRHDKSVISDWKILCKRLALHIPAFQLRLSLICYTNDYETARSIIQPMMELPFLEACSIRISKESDLHLHHLAETAALQLTGRSKPVFRFTDLPGELQVRILEYTDLIAPFDLQWCPQSGYSCYCCYYTSRVTNACLVCREVRLYSFSDLKQDSFASQCGCWTFPSALFLVSHRIREDAIRIFYSRNHFFALPVKPGETCGSKIISPFVLRLPVTAVKYLRSVQFVFRQPHSDLDGNNSSHSNWSPTSETCSDWVPTIDLLGREAELKSLKLVFDSSDGWAYNTIWESLFFGGLHQEKWTSYQRMIEPMARLKGIQDFFVHLANWPVEDWDSDAHRRKHERILEQKVMGEEYDSISRGKLSSKHIWRENRTRDFN